MRTLSKASLILEKAPKAKVLNFDGLAAFFKKVRKRASQALFVVHLDLNPDEKTDRQIRGWGGEKNSQV